MSILEQEQREDIHFERVFRMNHGTAEREYYARTSELHSLVALACFALDKADPIIQDDSEVLIPTRRRRCARS